jgi:hypothetical protein
MSKFWKPALCGLALAAVASAAFAGGPAKKSSFDAFPSLTNNNLTDAVTVGSVVFSGRYRPQIASSVAAGATSSGQLTTSSGTGADSLTFNAYPIPGDTGDFCVMQFFIESSTGVISQSEAAARGAAGAVSCSVVISGTSVTFSASAPGH